MSKLRGNFYNLLSNKITLRNCMKLIYIVLEGNYLPKKHKYYFNCSFLFIFIDICYLSLMLKSLNKTII